MIHSHNFTYYTIQLTAFSCLTNLKGLRVFANKALFPKKFLSKAPQVPVKSASATSQHTYIKGQLTIYRVIVAYSLSALTELHVVM